MHVVPPIAAGIGIEGVIWLIILVFWGIAKIMQSGRKGSGPPGRPMPRPPSPMESELRDLLEELTGQTSPSRAPQSVEDEVEVELEEPEPPPPTRRPPPRVSQRPQVQRPAQAASARRVEQARRAVPPPSLSEPIAPPVADVAAGLSASFAQAMNTRSLSMQSVRLSMKGMSFHQSMGPSRQGTPALNLEALRDASSFRRFMTARMVLDPPKALERPGQSLSGI